MPYVNIYIYICVLTWYCLMVHAIAYMYTYIHVYMHTYIHAYMYTYIHIALGPSLSSSGADYDRCLGDRFNMAWFHFLVCSVLAYPWTWLRMLCIAWCYQAREHCRSWLPLIFHRMRAPTRLPHEHHVALLSTAWSSMSSFISVFGLDATCIFQLGSLAVLTNAPSSHAWFCNSLMANMERLA